MRHLFRNIVFVAALLVLAVFSVVPPGEKLRLGKDLRGGTTLVYSVQVDPGENPSDVLNQTISVLRDRIDPTGLLEIQMVAQGNDRIEVTMPLPSDEVKALRQAYEEALAEIGRCAVTGEVLDRVVTMDEPARDERLVELSCGDEERLRLLREAAGAADAARTARANYEALEAAGVASDEQLDELAGIVATAELQYEGSRAAVTGARLSAEQVRRVFELSNESRAIRDESGEFVPFPSPRERALEELEENHPDQWPQVREAYEAYQTYVQNRRSLDDPDDLKRLISAAGVPAFRITVDPQSAGGENTIPREQEIREDFRENGPLNVRLKDARWCKLNKLDSWYESVAELEALEADPAGYFAGRGYVVEEFNGEYFMLCWDVPGKRLTQNDGRWRVARAYQTSDNFGKPAIGFTMDARGARLLGALTGPNVGNKMAVLLDEEVYTAPVLNGNISRQGIIQGDFTPREIEYVIQVLTAGALQAKISPEPISQNTIAPEFGADNLRAGRDAGLIALVAVSVFMIFYYFVFGGVAVISLLINAVLILAAMSLNQAAFTLPGIAGIILTFGMAVDANVLIYERIREELRAGADLRTSVRLGYSKALSSIVDGNVTNLIICMVLAGGGPLEAVFPFDLQIPQEVKGFAITLGIGVVSTLFSALVVSRLLLALLVDVMRVKSLGMLPMAVPLIERGLEPRINWMGLRYVFVVISLGAVGIGVGMIVYQGEEMLDTEFRGGTQVTIDFRAAAPDDPAENVGPEGNYVMTRADFEARLDGYAAALPETDPLIELRNAEIIPINPAADGVTSDRFQIKTYLDESDEVLRGILSAFEGLVDSRPPLDFAGRQVTDGERAPAFPVLSSQVAEVVGRPGLRGDSSGFRGGVLILLEGLSPRPTEANLERRLAQARGGEAFTDTLNRNAEVLVLRGSPDAVETAAVLVSDPGVSYLTNRTQWEEQLRDREWALVRLALADTTQVASVQSFSPVIAETFQQTAIVAVLLSLLMILIYIWVRFGSVRYSLAAIVTLLHDVLTAVGLIALAEILYTSESTAQFARSIGIEPFKIDLNLIAAVLTIIGYSLNDTIIIMDRIRENRGKLPYATKEAINLSINQTVSRTVITSGTTLLATLILYVYGGPGVRAFSYALLIGVGVGTYSSIAVAAPLVWSRRKGGPGELEEQTEAPRLP